MGIEDDSQCFAIAEITGKGHGMVASRDIAIGELIISEKALIQLSDADADRMEDVLQEQIDALNDKEKQSFWCLTDCRATPPEKTALGVFKTNGLPTLQSAGLFATIARCNHSCVPNAYHTWRHKAQEEQLRATQNIKKGEEICISYFQTNEDFLTRDQRQTKLKEVFGFDCTCLHCSLPEEEQKQNDEKRLKFYRDEGIFRKLIVASYMSAKERFKAAEDCGPPFGHGEKARIAHDAFILAQFLGMQDDAKKWCLLSYEFRAIAEGIDSVDAQRMLYCLKNFL